MLQLYMKIPFLLRPMSFLLSFLLHGAASMANQTRITAATNYMMFISCFTHHLLKGKREYVYINNSSSSPFIGEPMVFSVYLLMKILLHSLASFPFSLEENEENDFSSVICAFSAWIIKNRFIFHLMGRAYILSCVAPSANEKKEVI